MKDQDGVTMKNGLRGKGRLAFNVLLISLCLLFIVHRHTAYMVLDLFILAGIVLLLVDFRRSIAVFRGASRPVVLIPVIYVAGHMMSVIWYGAYAVFPATSLYLYALMPVIVLVFMRFDLDESWFWVGICLAAIVAGLYAINEVFINGGPRAGGSFHKPIIFGDLSLMLGLLAMMASVNLYHRHRGLLLLSMLGCTSGIVASLLSLSRGGWLFIPLVLAIVAWFYKDVWRHSVVLRRGGVAALAIFAIIVGMYMPVLYKRVDKGVNEVQSYLDNEDRVTSISTRFELWMGAVRIISNHPVVGVGLDKFDDRIRTMIAEEEIPRGAAGYEHAHNQILHAWATAGVFGLAGLLAAFVIPLRFFYRNCRSDDLPLRAVAIAGVLLVTGFFVFCLTDSLFTVSHAVKFYFFFMLALACFTVKRKSMRHQA